MKKIIDGKIYNTDTAQCVIPLRSKVDRADFGYWECDLYRTVKGNWFICGEGNGASIFAERVGTGTFFGSGIRVVSLHWVRDELERAEYYQALEKYFDIEEA